MSISKVWSVLIVTCLSFLISGIAWVSHGMMGHSAVASPLPTMAAIATNPGIPEPISIARIRSGLLPGVVIGGRHEGILRILQQPYTATGLIDEQLENATRQVIEETLMTAGYPVAESGGHSIFSEEIAEVAEPARFLIGGTIVQAQLNTYSSLWGNTTEDQRTIRWEILDRQVNKIIARQETTGTASAPGSDNLAATYGAIQASFSQFFSQPSVVATLQEAAIADLPTSPAKPTYTIAARPSSPTSLKVEHITGQTIPGLVSVQTSSGRGSGFFVDPSGLIVTNQHVVASAFGVKVQLYDGSLHTARVLKRDAIADVALLKLEGDLPEIQALPVCYTDRVKVGEDVVAIGNPLSLSNTVTKGIISAIRMQPHRTLLQTDVAINPGNSGGPLLNQQGVVVGIVTEKVASRGVEGLGFALPIGEALQTLGVQIDTPNPAALDQCGNLFAQAS